MKYKVSILGLRLVLLLCNLVLLAAAWVRVYLVNIISWSLGASYTAVGGSLGWDQKLMNNCFAGDISSLAGAEATYC